MIVDHGMREMLVEQEDVFYYVTVMNENLAQPSLPAEAHEGILRGMYRLPRIGLRRARARVRLLGSGAICGEVIRRRRRCAAEHGVAADVFSVTSFSELGARRRRRRDRAGGTARPRDAQPRRRAARADARADRHRHRLRARRARADPRLPAARPALRDARHRRLRPQRHARRAARASSRSTPRRSSRRRCARLG